MSWLYRRIVEDSQRRHVAAAYIFLPMVPEMRVFERHRPADRGWLEASGFVVLDLSDVYVGSDRNSLWVAEWDAHPNAAVIDSSPTGSTP